MQIESKFPVLRDELLQPEMVEVWNSKRSIDQDNFDKTSIHSTKSQTNSFMFHVKCIVGNRVIMQGKLTLRVHTEREFALHVHPSKSYYTRQWTQS